MLKEFFYSFTHFDLMLFFIAVFLSAVLLQYRKESKAKIKSKKVYSDLSLALMKMHRENPIDDQKERYPFIKPKHYNPEIYQRKN